ncbi:MAG: hypothetical protein DWQ31_08605 [Planctomycetota bacterium]|nr:MAG: hypothetical protein DWQ31_08605 [Planctomycetota bacterium]REJ86946.1 MAG: hypothetical protein DWQ35_22565 [Planctomycetota bacterium]REK24927.1 MAG: hypothetical protein DWQ42_12605 [Planctomycetota bacterium]REK48516.1 MAG: hypothetical protein DWQ46_02135 [Planctomycetota bacterium]
MFSDSQLCVDDIPQDVRAELGRLYREITSYTGLMRLLRRQFPSEERTQLIRDRANGEQVLEIWIRKFGQAPIAGLIEAAVRIGFIDSTYADWLRSESGLSTTALGDERPSWDRRSGILSYEGKTIRKVKIYETPTPIQTILDAFQDADWPIVLENREIDPLKLDQTLFSLNKHLLEIRFSNRKSGKYIHWHRRNAK